jgi:hypothetical protein
VAAFDAVEHSFDGVELGFGVLVGGAQCRQVRGPAAGQVGAGTIVTADCVDAVLEPVASYRRAPEGGQRRLEPRGQILLGRRNR